MNSQPKMLGATGRRCLAATSRLLPAASKRCAAFQHSLVPPRVPASHTTAHLPQFGWSHQHQHGAGRGRCSAAAQGAAAEAQQQQDNYYTVTTPLYYVNAAPHMGSAYPTIAADVAARFQRLLGKRVRFVTGTDEHGEKIAAAAAKRGMSPQAHCDDIVRQYEELWGQLGIRYDRFIRTTEPHHEALVVDVLARCWAQGDIYPAQYEGWYCVDCEEFKDEKEMVAIPGAGAEGAEEPHCCPTHRRACQHRKESNYFFRLSKYQREVEALLASEEFVQPLSRRNELMSYVREGLRDFSISRTAVEWGIRMPQDGAHTVYVWFDALIGYLSGLLPTEAGAPRADALPAHGWPASCHIIGKDILRFHAIYWPGMLISAGLPLPKRVYGHGFLTRDGLKMGKALGNTLDPGALVRGYGPDAVRLYFMKEIIFGQDGDFSEARFRDVVNAALANNLGNGLNRTLNLLAKFCDGAMPIGAAALPKDSPLRVLAAEKLPVAASAYGALAFHDAAEAVLSLASRSNQYLEETQPWTKLKKGTPEEQAEAASVLVAVLEAVRIVAVGLCPITPALSERIYAQLGYSQEQFQALTWVDSAWGGLGAGHKTAPPAPVFARLEDPNAPPADAPPAKQQQQGGGKKGGKQQQQGGGKKGGKQQQQQTEAQQERQPVQAATAQ